MYISGRLVEHRLSLENTEQLNSARGKWISVKIKKIPKNCWKNLKDKN